ncbi:hypothetical protein Vadar_012557 [Vaccinium darrowii]|uniref:Uncharacterized protein n=1 Tax=Vaccinium darrowii TaxID=229202 RepID=A0ACB7XYT8_9ERIC|nr:hypothetical protein Vadar_012557 [Vaccinium darrowii]
MATAAIELNQPDPTSSNEACSSKTAASKQWEGLRQYYLQHIHDLQLQVRQKTHNLKRLKFGCLNTSGCSKVEARVKKEEKEEKLDGDATLNKFFKGIYQDVDEDTRRAMQKSFVVLLNVSNNKLEFLPKSIRSCLSLEELQANGHVRLLCSSSGNVRLQFTTTSLNLIQWKCRYSSKYRVLLTETPLQSCLFTGKSC